MCPSTCQFPWVSVRQWGKLSLLKPQKSFAASGGGKPEIKEPRASCWHLNGESFRDSCWLLVGCGPCLALLGLQVHVFNLLFNCHVTCSLCPSFHRGSQRDLSHVLGSLRRNWGYKWVPKCLATLEVLGSSSRESSLISLMQDH